MVNLNDEFSLIEEARDTIRRYILDGGESYAFYKLDWRRYIITCKVLDCKFRIRASRTKKAVKITIKIPYT